MEIKESCGLFGIFGNGEDVARVTFFGLYALQHRGQESAGIAVTNGESIIYYKDLGLVNQVFDEKILQMLKGKISIGHVRYSTTGSNRLSNAQPIISSEGDFPIALAHNGNIVNAIEMFEKLESMGYRFESATDSEVIMNFIKSLGTNDILQCLEEVMKKIRGAYSLLIMVKDKLIGLRDPWGIRPLSLGKMNNSFVLSSETCAFHTIGAEFIREIKPGEVVIISKDGLKSYSLVDTHREFMCIFEFIYFARPDSRIFGKNLHYVRRMMGQELANEHFMPADLVIGVPDSGTPASIGYAEKSGICWGEGLIKNRYIHRTFIQPDQRLRELGVRMKLTPLTENIKGKKLVVVEDSIVRGTTTSSIVKLLRESGANEVHLRISSPPYKFPCFYGIDTAKREELIASKNTVDEVKEIIEADSLKYLSIEGLIKAIGLSEDKFCLACFNDKYPIPIPQQLQIDKFCLERV